MKKSTIIKAIVTILLIAYLVSKIKIDEILSVLAGSSISYLLLSLLLLIPMLLLRGMKWNFLLKSTGVHISLLESTKICLIGIFYSLFTPGKAGELMRAFYTKKPKEIIMPTVIWDKLIDIFLLVILSFVSLIVLVKNQMIAYLLILVIAMLITTAWLSMNKRAVKLGMRLFKIPADAEKKYMETMQAIMKDKKAIIKNAAAGLGFYLLGIVMAAIIITAMSKGITPMLALGLPLIALLGNFPISISGFGVREGVSVVVFNSQGVAPAYGFSFSILLFLTSTLVPGIIGYFLMLKHS